MLKEFNSLVQFALVHGRGLSTHEKFLEMADTVRGYVEAAERDIAEIDLRLLEAGYPAGDNSLPARLEALLTRVHNWTPVARALPEDDEYVLCSAVDGDGSVVSLFVGYQTDGVWWPLNGSLPAMVTHWCEMEPLTAEEKPAEAPLEPETLKDLLSLVGVDYPLKAIENWTEQQIEQAGEWASSVYLQASDNGDVEVPPRPKFLTGYGGHLDPAWCHKCSRRMEARKTPDNRSIWFCGDCGRENPV